MWSICQLIASISNVLFIRRGTRWPQYRIVAQNSTPNYYQFVSRPRSTNYYLFDVHYQLSTSLYAVHYTYTFTFRVPMPYIKAFSVISFVSWFFFYLFSFLSLVTFYTVGQSIRAGTPTYTYNHSLVWRRWHFTSNYSTHLRLFGSSRGLFP